MYIITYDIVKDKTRTKVSKILEDYGNRVQYSVFESDISEIELESIKNRIKGLIDVSTDNVKFYSLCAACDTKILSLGVDKSFKVPEIIAV